jgi:hypothetical protein
LQQRRRGLRRLIAKEFARYLDISIKSASEADYQLQLAFDLGVLRYDLWQPLADEIVELRKMLWGLRRAVLASTEGEDNEKGERQESEPDEAELTPDTSYSNSSANNWPSHEKELAKPKPSG